MTEQRDFDKALGGAWTTRRTNLEFVPHLRGMIMKNFWYFLHSRRLGRIGALWLVEMGMLLAVAVLSELFISGPQLVNAQGSIAIDLHTTVSDWNQGCAGITNTVVANSGGGELRLAATVEDYFDGTQIDTTRWISNISNPGAGGSPATSIGSGLLTLDGTYLLSTAAITALPRFFEARARLMQTPNTSGRPDVGFWRHPTLGPLYDPDPNAGGSRLFILGNTGGVGQDENDLLTGARNGSTVTLNDIETDPDMTQYHLWRVEWESNQARFYVNGVLTDTITIASTIITGWVFLYHQTPSNPYGSTPMTVDWVRGGQYPSSGTYVSCPMDGIGPNWISMYWNETVPGSTGVAMRTRASTDGVNWSAWSAPTTTNPFSITTNARFLQYMVEMTSTNPMFSPEIQSISATRRTGPTAVRLTDFRSQSEPWQGWRYVVVLGIGAILLSALGLRALRT
jgi:hypothetical protein